MGHDGLLFSFSHAVVPIHALLSSFHVPTELILITKQGVGHEMPKKICCIIVSHEYIHAQGLNDDSACLILPSFQGHKESLDIKHEICSTLEGLWVNKAP